MSKLAKGRQQEVQRVVDALSIAIAHHRLKPGTRLIEAQIVEVLSANRNHVQAALQRLALQHIVTIEPNRGAKVAQPSARESREVFIARRAVEDAVISGITPGKIEQHREEIEDHLLAEQRALVSGDRRDIIRVLSQFHRLLAKISDNQVLIEILANLMVRSSLIVALYQHNESPACQCGEHAAVLDALRTGDNALARTLMNQHLHRLEQQLDLTETPETAFTLRDALTSPRKQ